MKNAMIVSMVVFLLSCQKTPLKGLEEENNLTLSASYSFVDWSLSGDEKSIDISWTKAIDPNLEKIYYTLVIEGDTLVSGQEDTNYVFSGFPYGFFAEGRVIAHNMKGEKSESYFILNPFEGKYLESPLSTGYFRVDDPTFEKRLILNAIDSDRAVNSIVKLADVVDVDTLVIGRGATAVNSLKGIEHFKSLKYLDCAHNELKSLDLSSNTTLEYLNCSGYMGGGGYQPNVTEYLRVPKTLKVLRAEDNEFISLDLSKLNMLEELYLGSRYLSELDLRNCEGLKIFTFGSNNGHYPEKLKVYVRNLADITDKWDKKSFIHYEVIK